MTLANTGILNFPSKNRNVRCKKQTNCSKFKKKKKAIKGLRNQINYSLNHLLVSSGVIQVANASSQEIKSNGMKSMSYLNQLKCENCND